MNGNDTRVKSAGVGYPNPQLVQRGLSGPGAEVLRQIAQTAQLGARK